MTKPTHMAAQVNNRGGISALCYAAPREINPAKAEWTLVPAQVTCPKCRRRMQAATQSRPAAPKGPPGG